jgi:4-aminobutyrate aminotransferase-like enzyme
MLVEPCQGRGGEVIPPLDFLRMLRNLCDTYKILLVFDEIYTGFNRTGALFASDQFGVFPDLICVGKGLTTGLPLSACIGRAEVMDSWPKSQGEALHTTTFLGNPVACAAALASIELHLDPGIARNVRRLGDQFRTQLTEGIPPSRSNVRGLGLMIGIEIVREDGTPDPPFTAKIVRTALKEGLILLGGGLFGNVVTLTPPLCITPEEIEFACTRIHGYFRFGSVS